MAVRTAANITEVDIPSPPFLATRVVDDIDLEKIFPFINKMALYRGQWQFKKGQLDPQSYQAMIAEKVDPIFERLCRQCKDEEILTPKLVYGYFPCHSDGNDLIVYDPADPQRQLERFTFPRQSSRGRLCIADFFRPAGAGDPDVLGLSCVTMGSVVSLRAKALFEGNQYSEYLYLHGFGVEAAEALAEYWHKWMRQELGIVDNDSSQVAGLFKQQYRGSRYSFGYPACPELSDQEKLFRLLNPHRIGCELTENWQIEPEQSTSALIVHHPEAKYFSV